MTSPDDVTKTRTRRRFSRTLGFSLLVAVAAMGVITWRIGVQPRNRLGQAATSAEEPAIERLVASEELILALVPRLRTLDRSLANLRLPDAEGIDLFADSVEVRDMAGKPDRTSESLERTSIALLDWPVEPASHRLARADLALLGPALAEVRYFEHAHFYFIEADFADDAREQFNAQVGLTTLARTGDGWETLKGGFRVEFRRAPGKFDNPAEAWSIVRWELLEMHSQRAPQRMFTEVLDTALPRSDDRARARDSQQERYIVELVRNDQFKLPHPRFHPHSQDRHPGLAVVDIDRDGWDDLYVMDQWGKNFLLRNQGNGQFVDVASDYGLDLKDHCAAAIFADFDNDGDDDAIIGRTLAESVFLRRDENRYTDVSNEAFAGPLPNLVSSVTAVDVNRDGLLDLYFSTYAAEAIKQDLIERAARKQHWLARWLPLASGLLVDLLPPQTAEDLLKRSADSQEYADRVGPPNRLYLGAKRGRFELSPHSGELEIWRNSYQSTWCDFDRDGDDDVYVANDFAPNNLLENQGDGSFVDVTARTGTADVGFGMGATWGDYDNDGRDDLYVSNMFSKAGRRITGRLSGRVDPRFARMASGNSLFHQEDSTFRKVSGLKAPALMVEMAGWSWGSQFFDFDNDGDLDLFAPCGYYSAPKAISRDVDL